VRTFRRLTRGWASNEIAAMNKEKATLAAEFNSLELKVEQNTILDAEKERMKEVANNLNRIWALEEIKGRQRARDRDILEGDRNTAYCQAVANQRNRKNRIESLEGPNGLVEDGQGMMKIVVDFYKNLFRKEKKRRYLSGRELLGRNR
jgi:hypothetical protein